MERKARMQPAWAVCITMLCASVAQAQVINSTPELPGAKAPPTVSATPKPAPAPVKDAPVQSQRPDHFGKGQPASIDDLPYGQLKIQLLQLPPQAKARAMKDLQAVEFPKEDVDTMRVSKRGGVYFRDTMEGALSEPSGSVDMAFPLTMAPEEVFQLHSRPGSTNVVYLDFDGGELHPDAEWNPWNDTYTLQPFDPSANDPSAYEADFTEEELSIIVEIWHRMAEDFAAFDIDVTTEEPAVFTPTTGRVAFTHHTDALGRNLPSSSAGGTAYLNKFGASDYATRWSPALVYYTRASVSTPGKPTSTAELGSHEFGHNLGLSHDGTTSGSSYYSGHGSGNTSWAPIMGSPFNKAVTTWSKGNYTGANNTQDDVAIIGSKLGFASDDHANWIPNATPIRVEANGDILAASAQDDPHNVINDNEGVINNATDRDYFTIELATDGRLVLSAIPSWHSFPRDGSRGANMDIKMSLRNESGQVLRQSNPYGDTFAALDETLSAGTYYIDVFGPGLSGIYSNEELLGRYFLEGYITQDDDGGGGGTQPDTQAPSPGTMSFSTAPYATGTSGISMTAVAANDDSGTVEYKFRCVSGDSACQDSGWRTGRNWSLSGLTPDTEYAFTVQARDRYGNLNQVSSSKSARTQAVAVNQAPQAVAGYEESTAIINKGNHADVRIDGSDSHDPDGSIASWQWTDSSGNVISQSAVFTRRLASGTHSLKLRVTDNGGLSDSTTISINVSKAGDGGGDDGGGGGNGGGNNGKKPPKG